jgi:regulator of protease activity HflC (stomatin/prohibitin superfamily)
MDKELKSILTKVGAVVVGLLSLFFLFGSFSVIKPGNAGVVFNQLSGSLRTVGQGLALKLPFVTDVQSYPTSLRTYTMVFKSNEGSSKDGDDSIDLPTKEGQHIKQDISITYNTSEDKASDVFKAFKGADIEDIENTFIRRTAITVAQNVAGQMSLSEVISSSRDKLQTSIQAALSIELAKMGFNLDKVNLGASHLPKAIEDQMQQKMAAQQQAQQADYELQKQETLAKAAVAKARGEADSALITAEAEAKANALKLKTLTPELIRYQATQKWDGKLPTMMGGNGVVPFINVGGKE